MAISTRFKFIKDGAQGVNDIEVGFFVPATDVVSFTQFTGLKHSADGAAMVFDVEPVADLLAITINR